jgi:hypothetical protein
MAMKACSTLVASFALVSMKGIPISSAKAYRGQKGWRWEVGREEKVSSVISIAWSGQIHTCLYTAYNSSLDKEKLALPLPAHMTQLYLKWDQTCFQPEVCSHYH